jgi:hypothetical protein
MLKPGVRVPFFALIAVVFLSGCGDFRRPKRLVFPDRSLATVQRVAKEIDKDLNDLEVRNGSFSTDDATSKFTAWIDAGEVRRIEENLNLGEYGNSRILYYFHRNALFFYHELAQRSGAGRVGGGEIVERDFAFDSYGQLVENRKVIQGRSAPIEDYELVAIRRHTDQLKREILR